MCELATATDDEGLAQVVAATLGVLARPAFTLAASIIDALRLRELVLVLDNCEHIVEAVGRLAEGLLRECPGVRILATSREALGIAGEQVWPLPSLELPARTSSLDVVAASESVRLFTERAQGVQPGFVLDETNMDAVAEICRRLDGIPLAVELAAARVTIMTPADIAARLDQRFQLLTGGRRSAAERHQTLRGAIEWSYELLDERERALFVRLGAFPGTFDADAVAAVATGDGLEAWDVLDAGAGPRGEVDDRGRRGERDHPVPDARDDPHVRPRATRCRGRSPRDVPPSRRALHAASRKRPMPGSPVPTRSRGASASTSSSTTSAPRSSAASGCGEDDDVRRALRIVAALAFEAVNDRGLGIGGWAEHLVPRVDLAPPAVRTAVLAAAAFSAQGRNDVVAMRELAAAALRDGVPPDCPGAVWAYIAIAANEGMSGDWAAAVRVIDDAIAALRAAGDAPRGLSFLYSAEANFHNLLADHDAARVDADLALQEARRSGNPTATASAQFARAVALIRDDPGAAASALDESIELGRLGTSGGLLGFALSRRSVLRAEAGDAAGAGRDAREAVKHGHERGDRPMLTSALECSVAVLQVVGREEAAAVLAGGARRGRDHRGRPSADRGARRRPRRGGVVATGARGPG